MLCHTQYIRNLALNEQSSGRTLVVCLCPLPTSNVKPFRWDWGPPCTNLLLEGDVWIPTQPKEFCWFLKWQECVTYRDHGSLVALYRGAVKCTTLLLWAANLKPFLVAHSCMAFTDCCMFFYGIEGAPTKRVFWRCPWQYERAAQSLFQSM